MAFAWATMTDAIANHLAAVDGVGKVHKQRRVMRDEDAVKRLGLVPAQKRINVWMISPAAANATITERGTGFSTIGTIGGGIVGANRGSILQTLQFQVEAWFSLQDADDSETKFRDLVYAVTDRFNGMGKLTDDVTFQLPMDVDVFSYAMFAGGYLTHYARMGFGVQGKIS